MSTHDSTINRDSQAYWNKRAATFTRSTTSDYERWLLDLLALEAGEEVLNMGCATGTLAVPLARSGHRYRLGKGRGTMGPGLSLTRHMGVHRLAHRREPVELTQPQPLPWFIPRRGGACAP